MQHSHGAHAHGHSHGGGGKPCCEESSGLAPGVAAALSGMEQGHSHGAKAQTSSNGIETNLRPIEELRQADTSAVLLSILKYCFSSVSAFLEVTVHIIGMVAIVTLFFSSLYPLIFLRQSECTFSSFLRVVTAFVGWSCITAFSQKLLLYRYAPLYRIKSCTSTDQVVQMRMRIRMVLPQTWWFATIVSLVYLYLIMFIKKGCTEMCCGVEDTPYFQITFRVKLPRFCLCCADCFAQIIYS